MSSVVLPSGVPRWLHHLPAAGLAVVAVGLLAGLPELLGTFGRLAAVVVLQLGLVLAWVLVTGIHEFVGSLALGAATAVAADLVLVLPEQAELSGLLVVFGVGFLALVLQQMLRTPRPDLVASLAGGVVLFCAVGSLAALLLVGEPDGSARPAVVVLAVGAALVVGHLVDAVLPRPQLSLDVPRGLVGLVLSVVAAAGLVYLVRDTGTLYDGVAALIYGGALGAVAALTAVAASYLVVEASTDEFTAAAPVEYEPDGSGEEPADPPRVAAPPEPRYSAWALPVIQVVLPLAACAPVALGLQTVL